MFKNSKKIKLDEKKLKNIIKILILTNLLVPILICISDDFLYHAKEKECFFEYDVYKRYFNLFDVIISNPINEKVILTSDGHSDFGFMVNIWDYDEEAMNDLKLFANPMDKDFVENKLECGEEYFNEKLKEKNFNREEILSEDNLFIYYHKYNSGAVMNEYLPYQAFSILILDVDNNLVYEFLYIS